ncbi:MAG TPA: geranylgeranyl reductase family protein [Acidimicrobiales bacterium]
MPTPAGQLTTDVAVVGAGPAGSAAAITLARLGRTVVLVDKATFPRDKCCGDGLTTAALRLLEDLRFDPRSVPSWEPVDEAVVVVPGGRQVRLPLPADGTQFAASARRSELDAALVQLAAAAGAEVIEGHAVTGVTGASLGDGVRLDLDDGRQVRARYVIAADGMWSPVRKALGLGEAGYLGDWQAGRQYFTGVGPAARKLWVWFEPDMRPGYAWSFPLPGGTANVGYGVVREPGQPPGPLKGQRIDLRARPQIAAVLGPDATPAGPWKAWPIPAGIGSATLSGVGGRVLFAGDAARACDPMTGEGIAQAMETAELAARAITTAGPDQPAAAAARYQRQIRWGLAVDDRLARDLSGVLAHRRGARGALRIVDTGGWSRRHFARWMFEDYPRAVLVTPHRWRRHLLGRRGAFAAAPG